MFATKLIASGRGYSTFAHTSFHMPSTSISDMPRHDDALTPTSTAELRGLASTYFPNKGASRMGRAVLVTFFLQEMVNEEVASTASALRRSGDSPDSIAAATSSVHKTMRTRYGSHLFHQYLVSTARSSDDRIRSEESFTSETSDDTTTRETGSLANDWPRRISPETNAECSAAFRESTNIQVEATCAVCARRTFTKDLLFTPTHATCTRVRADSLPLHMLTITDEHILARPGNHFKFTDRSLNDLALDSAGLHFLDSHTEVDICDECKSPLSKLPPKLPALALANGNIRGVLPQHLQDCTWLEERLCARYLASACVVRLYDLTAPGAPEHRQRVMKGHACSFPLNTVATAAKLPWAFGDGGPLVSCLWIGPRKPTLSDLRNVFKVRREKVQQLLKFLQDNFQDYPDVEIDHKALASLPMDDVPELIMRHVVFEASGTVSSLFDKETAGLELHPALASLEDDVDLEGRTYLEHHGLIDINGIGVPEHARTASALVNATGTERPDLIIRHGSQFVPEYNNPALFPGMFPLLFPWGTGGFEAEREVPLSFGRQAKHLLDLADSAFRRHWSFIFIVANIKQRRIIHLSSRLACKKKNFTQIAKTLQQLDADTVQRVAEHLQCGGSLRSLVGDEQRIYTLLKKCELLSVRVPGSKAAMNRARSDIRGYIGEFGIFQLFLTLNPHPEYSPMFQVFYGDTEIDLGLRAPLSSTLSARLVQVAEDPVAAADYFHFQIAAIFQHLFGWDIRKKMSSPNGGILGRLAGFFMVKEHTMRGQLHGHILLWLEGGLNPRELRHKLGQSSNFRDNYLAFLDDIIQHHLPPKDLNFTSEEVSSDVAQPVPVSTSAAREETPPNPLDPKYADLFRQDHSRLGEVLQRHVCRATCFKGGRTSCRFLFPHDLNPETTFDAETNSINMRVQDPTVNWHNPTLLVATRHNHDLKCVQSGKSSAAAAAYITNYATKSEETPANQVSMINTVYRRMAEHDDTSVEAKALLTKCVMQFGRERQLHAQQVVTYVRDLGDTMESHNTVPMLSGSMLSHVHKRFGFPRQQSSEASEPTTSDGAAASAPSAAHDRIQGEEGIDDDEQSDTDELLAISTAGIAHQVDDYLHRGSSLADVSFYEFVKFTTLVPKPKHPNKSHHPLSDTHPNAPSHYHRHTPTRPRGIPRAIFRSFPRPDGSEKHGESYCAAMLSHFVPFSISQPLKRRDESYEDRFANADFSPSAVRVMTNWQALTECDDARDHDQLLRRKREAFRSAQHDADSLHQDAAAGGDDPDADVNAAALEGKSARQSAETVAFLNTLQGSGWFDSVAHHGPAAHVENTQHCPPFTSARRKQWKAEQDRLEAEHLANTAVPKASTGVLAQDLGFENHCDAPSTSITADDDIDVREDAIIQPDTIRLLWKTLPPHDLIQALVEERGLNASQSLSFKIVARHFFEGLYGRQQDPLRMLMHGEAGTGKTVVVRLFRELLDRFGKGKDIMFLAPTGKAACAIGGMTQHSAFALEVRQRGIANEDLPHAQDAGSARRLQYLQTTFKNITWLFFDEVSMTSCEVMADIDSALRIGTQRLDQPFGGVNVIFAGDLCQLPPVASSALYTQQSSRFQPAEQRTKVELGRAAWLHLNCVVEFKEQMRMQDPEMAAALSRLRVRKSYAEDVDLFNSRVLSSSANTPASLANLRSGSATCPSSSAVALARTNETVRVLNLRKAEAQAITSSNVLVISNAEDKSTAPLSERDRNSLLSYHGSARTRGAIGRVPLFLGMPVVYRGKNQSVPLGITNGAFATVAGWDLVRDEWGLTVPRGVILKFSEHAKWALSGLEAGCLPIQPATSVFKYTTGGTETPTQQISRRQLPLQPGFAMTVHSAQGITAHGGIIVDLRGGGFEAYVAASRATTRESVFLLAPVTLYQLNGPAIPKTLVEELARLAHLADQTRTQHGHDRWRLAESLKRSADTSVAGLSHPRGHKHPRVVHPSDVSPESSSPDAAIIPVVSRPSLTPVSPNAAPPSAI